MTTSAPPDTTSPTTHPQKLLTVPEVTEILNVGPRTVWEWIREGRITAVHIGPKSVRVTPADLAQFIESRRR